MIVVLNGPLGVGKSTLAEALTERIKWSLWLDGDRLIAGNPPAKDELEHVHSTIALLVAHHRTFGYRHFVIDHTWRSSPELDDMRRRLVGIDADFRCFLLCLDVDENLRRIEHRASARAIDEYDFERRMLAEEREALAQSRATGLGEGFDVSAPPLELVEQMLQRLGLQS